MDIGKLIVAIVILLIALALTVFGAYLAIQGIKNGNVVTFVIGVNMFATCLVGFCNILGAIDVSSDKEESTENIEATEENEEAEAGTLEDYSDAGDVENTELAY